MPGTNEAGRGDWHLWHENMGWTQIPKYLVTTTEGIRASEGILTKPCLEAQEAQESLKTWSAV
jgi:hypothetical protein